MSAFWGITASNAVVATVLALGAVLLARIWKNAAALHVVWVVVLLKLFTPPLVTTGLPFAVPLAPTAAGADSHEETLNLPTRDEPARTAPVAPTDSRVAVASSNPRHILGDRSTESAASGPWSLFTVLAAIWISGAGCTATGYMVRIRRFANAIRDMEAAPPDIRAMVDQLSVRLGLRRVPEVAMTSLTLPPMVWSIGRFPRVILPSDLFARLSREAQSTILAHELSHIRRGDHLVRLLELAATTIFWWHPVVRWASRQLRELEEQCCDGRVLELLPHQPRTYATAMVDTLEFLSEGPRTRVPLPTAIDSTGSLSRRIRMLTRNRTNRLSALSTALVAGLVALPLVVAFAADPGQASKTGAEGQQSAGARAAILRGRVTDEAGTPLADVRVRVAIPAADMRFVDPTTRHKQLEARSDARGDYRLEILGITQRTTISIDAMKPGYRRLVGTLMAGGDAKRVEIAQGMAAEASLVLKPALYCNGIVVDEQGKPIPAVEIASDIVFGRGRAGIERIASPPDGSFELFCYPEKPPAVQTSTAKGVVTFFHPDYVDAKIEDVYALAPKERKALRIVLPTGYKVTGTVLDAAGKPVPNAMIKVTRKDGTHRKATLTDANGKFALRGLSEGLTKFGARALEIHQKIDLPMALNGDKTDLEVRLRPIPLPADLNKHAVLGMQLTDATAELKSAYDLYDDRGALILDPGKDSGRLGIGRLAEGCCFFMVGNKRIGNVREFVDRILAETAGQGGDEFSVRVVYSFSTVEFDGSRTARMRLTKGDREQLRAFSDQLTPEE